MHLTKDSQSLFAWLLIGKSGRRHVVGREQSDPLEKCRSWLEWKHERSKEFWLMEPFFCSGGRPTRPMRM